MKGVRFTKAELAYLRNVVPALTREGKSIHAKLASAETPAAKGADVGPIQSALVAAARGKVVALEGGFAQASRRCADNGVTPESAQLVGEWMARQGWLHGPQTLLDVLNKWPSWLAKAKASAPPPSLEAGFGETKDLGRGAAGAGPSPQGRRSTPGFR